MTYNRPLIPRVQALYEELLALVRDKGPVKVSSPGALAAELRRLGYSQPAVSAADKRAGAPHDPTTSLIARADARGDLVVLTQWANTVTDGREPKKFYTALYTPQQAIERDVIPHTKGERPLSRAQRNANKSLLIESGPLTPDSSASFLTIAMYEALLNQADAADARVAELEAQIVLLTRERDEALAPAPPKPDPVQQGILHRLRQRGIE